MNAVNFFCEEECISLATKFYLGKTSKRKVCDVHAGSVPQALYPIDAYDFISSAEDTVLYEQRVETVTKGRKYLELLKKIANEELETALQNLDSAKEKAVHIVEKGYEANKRRTQQLHFQVEVEIKALHEEFDSYLRSRSHEVSKIGSLVLNGDQMTGSVLRMRVIDNSLELLEVVSQCVSQAQLSLEEYLSRTLDPELRKIESEDMLQMAEDESRLEDFIHLQNAAFKCGDSIALSFSEKATELSTSLELKLKAIEKERANTINTLFTSDTKAIHSLTETYTKDARTSEARKEWDDAKHSYLRAISYVAAFSCSKETAGLFFAFANFLVTQKRSGDAETYYTLALNIQREHFPEDGETADTYLKLADIYTAEKRLNEAEQFFNTAVSIRRLKLPYDYQTSKTSYRLAVFYQDLGRYQEAADVFSLALDIQRVCTPDEDNLVCILWSLGEVFRDLNRYQESVQAFIEAIKANTPNTRRQALLYKGLGDVYKSVQQSAESEESYSSALAVVKSLPLSSMNTALYLNNLGIEFERLKRFDDAEFCYQTGLTVVKEKGKESDPASLKDKKTSALLLCNLGGIKLQSNKYSEAIQNYNAALRVLVVHFPDTKQTAQTYLNLGLVRMQSNHMKEAEHCFRSATKMFDVVAPDCFGRVIAYMNLGVICHKAERFEEAEEYERLILIQLETQYPNEVITAQLLMNLGVLYHDTSQTTDAEICFVKSLQILENEHPNQLLLIGTLSYNLARNCVLQGNTEGAIDYFVKAISLRSNESEYSTGNQTVCFEYPKEVEEEIQPDEFSMRSTQGIIILPKYLCECYYLLGSIMCDEKQYEESEHYLTAALEHAKAIGEDDQESKARSELKKLYFNTKQFEKLRMLSK